MAKKIQVKHKKEWHKCPHCDLVMDFPVEYCVMGKHHCHTLFMGSPRGMLKGKPGDVCGDCWVSKNKIKGPFEDKSYINLSEGMGIRNMWETNEYDSESF